MKKFFLTLCGMGALLGGSAQQGPTPATPGKQAPRCLFDAVLQRAGVSYLQLASAYKQATPAGEAAKNAGVVYDIPVVFHVVYNPAKPAYNLPDSVLLNQLQILNNAFRKRHADTGKTRPFFKPLSADVQIQFHLATHNPFGQPTTGITRTVTALPCFGTSFADIDSLERVKSSFAGGIDPWPVDRYYNIWVCDMADRQGQLSVLGYGTPPLNPLPSNWPPGSQFLLTGMKDGVVMQTQAVGANNPLRAAVLDVSSRGRVLVHETGHYLGLQHTFGTGDGYTPMCGTPTQSDGIDDTPEQSAISFTVGGVPSPFKNSCVTGPNDSLDLWENYMDYTVDSFQTLFTHDQATLMRSVAALQRVTLPVPTGVTPVSQNDGFLLYPNPAVSTIQVAGIHKPTRATVFNVQGQPVLEWAGMAAAAAQYDVSQLPTGAYFMVLETAGGACKRGRFFVHR